MAINVSSAPCLSFLEILETIGLSDSSLGPSVCGEQCPSDVFCQMCAGDAVLDQVVDFIVMSTYQETNLDEDPCIFPSCGHILTMSSMDGIMDMAKHYTMSESTSDLSYPVALAASSSPFDMKEVKVCPRCRGSLRDVARYGRIVRRAVLDESTKRFINWARQRHSELALKLMEHKAQLEADKARQAKPSGYRQADDSGNKKKLFSGKGRSALMADLLLSTDAARHQPLIQTRREIARFTAKVAADEHPYRRVADHVQFAHSRRTIGATEGSNPAPGHFEFDESVIQIGSSLHAAVLLMRCDIHSLESISFVLDKATSFDKMHARIRGSSSQAQDEASHASAIQAVARSFRANRFAVLLNEFEATIAAAKSAKYTKQEVESCVCTAHLCIVLWQLMGSIGEGTGAEKETVTTGPADENTGGTGASTALSRTRLKELATQHVEKARALLQSAPSSQELFGPELDRLEAALGDLAGYQPVTAAEMQAVYRAMAGEFRGSGHWYTCANGHPFTVGECGMPMEQAQCPECGAAVGGHDHRNAAGVVAAVDIEELGRGVGRLAVG